MAVHALFAGWNSRARWVSTLFTSVALGRTQASAESIDRVILPSGLTVVIAEQHTTQAVDVHIAARAGPVHERDRLGVA